MPCCTAASAVVRTLLRLTVALLFVVPRYVSIVWPPDPALPRHGPHAHPSARGCTRTRPLHHGLRHGHLQCCCCCCCHPLVLPNPRLHPACTRGPWGLPHHPGQSKQHRQHQWQCGDRPRWGWCRWRCACRQPRLRVRHRQPESSWWWWQRCLSLPQAVGGLQLPGNHQGGADAGCGGRVPHVPGVVEPALRSEPVTSCIC